MRGSVLERSLLLAFATAVASLMLVVPVNAADPGVHTWGMNESAQLGTGNDEGPEDCFAGPHEFPCSMVPVSASSLGEAKSLDGGLYHSLAVLNDGAVMAWGNNDGGQLGTGNRQGPEICGGPGNHKPCAKKPTEVPGLSTATEVSAGEFFSLALLEDGTVWAWGAGYRGELGNGTDEESDSPVQVGLENVKQISAGGTFALALLEDGTVMAWGDNSYGQLGNGGTEDSNIPIEVEGLEHVKAVAAGGSHALALLEDGTLVAWGANVRGELGNGENHGPDICPGRGFINEGVVDEGCSETPIPVTGISNVTAIAAGGWDEGEGFSFAVLQSGGVKAWGSNNAGQLGDGTTTDRFTPVGVNGITSATTVVAGYYNGYALLEDHTVMSWGSGHYGQLGTGDMEGSDTPVGVDGLDGVSTLGAGWDLALASGTSHPLPTVTELDPNYGPLAGGTAVEIVGSNFTGATAVEFGTMLAVSFVVNSDTSITAVAPASVDTGGVYVRITTSAGISTTNDASIFNYGSIVTGVQPNDGPPAGGTEVTITGGNFTGSTAVKFGSEPAAGFVVNSDTSITATSPPGSEEIVDIRVTGPGGTSEINPSDRFGYGPLVSDIEPNGGPAVGGTEITITGFGLTDVEGVAFGLVPASSFTDNGDGTVTAVSPSFAGDSAAVPVTVTAHKEVSSTPNYSTLLAPNYFFYEPAITSIAPAEGPAAGGTVVVIHGTGFESVRGPDEEIGGSYVTAVYFGGSEAESFIINPENKEIKAVSPPGTGMVDVTVETYAGTSAAGSADHFTYRSPGSDGGLGQATGEGGDGQTPPGHSAQSACPRAVNACPAPPRHCPKGKHKATRIGKIVCINKHHKKHSRRARSKKKGRANEQ